MNFSTKSLLSLVRYSPDKLHVDRACAAVALKRACPQYFSDDRKPVCPGMLEEPAIFECENHFF
jgi:hypothetical protein